MGMSSNSPPPSARNARMPARGKAAVARAGFTSLASLRPLAARPTISRLRGSPASLGLPARASSLASEDAPTGPLSPMMRPMRRPEARNPRRSSAAFALRAPQARRFAPQAGTTSGASGSGRSGSSPRPRMLQQTGLGAPGIPRCADIG